MMPASFIAARAMCSTQVTDVPGVERAFIDRAGDVPQARLEIDRARAARYGLNVGDIEDQIEIGARRKARDRAVGGRAALQRRSSSRLG